MLFKLFAFIKFRLTSKNQHGIHSPFVYRYITKCLYADPRYRLSKSHNVLFKTISYFDLHTIHLTPTNIALEKELSQYFKKVTFTNTSEELIYIDRLDLAMVNKTIVQNSSITNDTVVFINNIYQTKDTGKLWSSIKELDQVRVTIDLFYCGLVFFRREQVKEHFKIRI